MDNYVLNKSLLSQGEQDEILAALHGLKAVHYPEVEKVLTKLSAVFGTRSKDWIAVDFSDWGDAKQETLAKIKTAILNRKLLFHLLQYLRRKNNPNRRTHTVVV